MQRGDMVYVTAHQRYGIVDHVGEHTMLVREFTWDLAEPGLANGTIQFTDLVWVRQREVIPFLPPPPPLRVA